MEKRKLMGLTKRTLCLILSLVMLVGIIYIPKAATTVEAVFLREIRDNWGSYQWPYGTYNASCLSGAGISWLRDTSISGSSTTVHQPSTINLYHFGGTRTGSGNSGAGHVIYCIEPGVNLLYRNNDSGHFDLYDDYIPTRATRLTGDQKLMLSYALTMGAQEFDVNKPQQCLEQIATQVIVWAISRGWYTDESKMNVLLSESPSGFLPSGQGLDTIAQDLWKSIKDLKNNTTPPFASDAPGPLYEMKPTSDGTSYRWNPADPPLNMPVNDWVKTHWNWTSGSAGVSVDPSGFTVTGDPGYNSSNNPVTFKGTPNFEWAKVGYLFMYDSRSSYYEWQQMICILEKHRPELYFRVWRPEMQYTLQKTITKATETVPVNGKDGFTFDIYTYNNNQKGATPKGRFTTGPDGKIILKESEGFGVGWYWAEEVSISPTTDGYYYHLASGAFEITRSSTDATVSANTLKLDNKEITVIIEKTIINDPPITRSKAGFYFNVYNYVPPTNYDDTTKKYVYGTDEYDSEMAYYLAKEIKSFTVGPTDDHGQITLYGTSPNGGNNPLPAGVYWFIEADQDENTNPEIKPNEPGYTDEFYLASGKVEVMNDQDEINPATGKPHPQILDIFNNKLIDIDLNKELDDRSADDSLDGFEFEIYKYNPNDPKNIIEPGKELGAPVAYVVTDETGMAKVNKKVNKTNPLSEEGPWEDEIDGTILPKGWYWVAEKLTLKSAKYLLIDMAIEVKNDLGTKQIFPVLENDLIEIAPQKDLDERLDEEFAEALGLDGFEFDIYEYDPTAEANVTKPGSLMGAPVAYVVTDVDGIARVNRLDPTNTSPALERKDLLDGSIMPPTTKIADITKLVLKDDDLIVTDGTTTILVGTGHYWVIERRNWKSSGFILVDQEILVTSMPKNVTKADGLEGAAKDLYLKSLIQYFTLLNKLTQDKPVKNVDDRLADPDKAGYEFDIYAYNPNDPANDPEQGGVPGTEMLLLPPEEGTDESPYIVPDPETGRVLYGVTKTVEIEGKKMGILMVNKDDLLGEHLPWDENVELSYIDGTMLPVRSEEQGDGWYWVKERLTEKSKSFYLIDEAFEVVNVKENIKTKHSDLFGEEPKEGVVRAEDTDNIQYFPVENELRRTVAEKTMEDGPRDKEGIKFRIFPSKFKDAYKAGTMTWDAIVAGAGKLIGSGDNKVLDADMAGKYYAEEFAIDADGNYTLVGIPEGSYWVEEQPDAKNVGYWLIDEEITICDDGFYIDGGEKVEYEGQRFTREKDNDSEEVRRYIYQPLKNEIIYVNVTIEKELQNSAGSRMTKQKNDVYEVTLTPYGAPYNRRPYTVKLNEGNGWKATINVASGNYYIEETNGGKGYIISYSQTIAGTLNQIEVKENGQDHLQRTNGLKHDISASFKVINRTPPPHTPPPTNPTTPTTTTTTEEPTTNTTEPTTPTTNGTTTGGGSEDETTTEPTIEDTTEPTIEESTTEPTVEEATRRRVPLSNGWFAEYDADEDLWYIYDENGMPLGTVKLPDGVSIEEYDFGDWIPPLGNIPSVDERVNPSTGDTLFFMAGLLILAAATSVFVLRRKGKKLN